MAAVVRGLLGLERQRQQTLRVLSGLTEDAKLALFLQQHCQRTENHLSRLTDLAERWNSGPGQISLWHKASIQDELHGILVEAPPCKSGDEKIAAAAQRMGRMKRGRCDAGARLAQRLGDSEAAETLRQISEEEKGIETPLRASAKAKHIKSGSSSRPVPNAG